MCRPCSIWHVCYTNGFVTNTIISHYSRDRHVICLARNLMKLNGLPCFKYGRISPTQFYINLNIIIFLDFLEYFQQCSNRKFQNYANMFVELMKLSRLHVCETNIIPIFFIRFVEAFPDSRKFIHSQGFSRLNSNYWMVISIFHISNAIFLRTDLFIRRRTKSDGFESWQCKDISASNNKALAYLSAIIEKN